MVPEVGKLQLRTMFRLTGNRKILDVLSNNGEFLKFGRLISLKVVIISNYTLRYSGSFIVRIIKKKVVQSKVWVSEEVEKNQLKSFSKFAVMLINILIYCIIQFQTPEGIS